MTPITVAPGLYLAAIMPTHKPQPSPFSPQVGEILKRVDGLVKQQDIDRARTEILRAREIEPKNMYVHAYFERVELLAEEQKRHRETEDAFRRKQEEEQKAAAEERKRLLEDIIRRKLEVAARQAPDVPASSRSHAEELEEYARAVNEAWAIGAPDASHVRELEHLRDQLHISREEHSALELPAQRESYMRAFKDLWTSSKAPDGPSSLTALRKRFGVKPGAFDGLELALIQDLRKPADRPRLVVIDDDPDLLSALKTMLNEEGFDVQAFSTSDEAYRHLQHHTPDLILADINLESSTMGGFAFFEKVQEIPRLASLPFIFVSGLTDELIQRAGKELGADDYVTKPFVHGTLLSVIRGKLRRYSEIGMLQRN